MNVLLVNNDPVVSKLVTLSTLKTGDRLDVAQSVEAVREGSYDLLILEVGLFSVDALEAINDKAIYAHSIYITTRDAPQTDLFEKILNKPFLPTELLVMLHQFSKSVEEEQEALAKEIVFDDLDESFFGEDEILADEPAIEDPVEAPVSLFEDEAVLEDEDFIFEVEEEKSLDTIFSDEEVSEVKAILDALSNEQSEQEQHAQELIEDVVEEDNIDEEEIDLELEAALRQFNEKDLPQKEDTLVEEEKEEVIEVIETGDANSETIETLKTLLQALENPLLAKSLRGTITINLTFGEDS